MSVHSLLLGKESNLMFLYAEAGSSVVLFSCFVTLLFAFSFFDVLDNKYSQFVSIIMSQLMFLKAYL